MIACRHKIRQNARLTILWLFFGHLLTMFSAKAQTLSICLNNSQTLLRYQKKKHLKNDKQSFQNVKGHMESVN